MQKNYKTLFSLVPYRKKSIDWVAIGSIELLQGIEKSNDVFDNFIDIFFAEKNRKNS